MKIKKDKTHVNAKLSSDSLALAVRGVAHKGDGWHVVVRGGADSWPSEASWKVHANCNIKTPVMGGVKTFVNVSYLHFFIF